MGWFRNNLFGAPDTPGEYTWKDMVDEFGWRILGAVEDPDTAPQASSTFIKQISGKIAQAWQAAASPVAAAIELFDAFGNSIWWILNAGGMFINDNITTLRDFVGLNNSAGVVLDIYGNIKLGGYNFTAHDGPPGNRLSFTTATMEAFQGSRAGTVADWTVAANCTTSSVDISAAGTAQGPDDLYHALQMQSMAAGTMGALSPGGIFVTPVTAGDPITALASFKAVTATRSCQLILKFFTSTAGTGYLSGSDINGSTVTDSTSAWTEARATGTVPATAQAVQIQVQVNSTGAAGEKHYVDAVGLYKLSSANVSKWSPPQCNQPISGTAYQGSQQYDRYWQKDAGVEWRQEAAGVSYPNAQVWKKASTTWS